MLSPVLVTPPAVTAVTLAEVKDHLRVEHDDHDAKLTGLIEASVDALDGWRGTLGRALIAQTWRVDMVCFADPIRLPLLPVDLASVAVAYVPAGETDPVALDPASIDVREDALGVMLARRSGVSWPSTAVLIDAVRVTFDAGYGAAATDVPAAIRQAIRLDVELGYEPLDPPRMEQLRKAIERLLAPYRVRRL